MDNLLPPSAFLLSDDSIESEKEEYRKSCEAQTEVLEYLTCSTQTSDMYRTDDIAAVEDFISSLLSGDDRTIPACEDEGLRNALSQLKCSFNEKTDTIQKLATAVHRTVPETLEHQRVVQSLQDDKENLESEVSGLTETITLLEKRMECQSTVLALQENTLTTNGSHQKMLEAWRNKVLQLLLHNEMDNMVDARSSMALQSKIDKLEKMIARNEDEIAILSNKNCDLQANLRLKEKHIQTVTNDLAAARHSHVKYQQITTYITETYSTITENVENVGTNLHRCLPDVSRISETLDKYEAQIDRISQNLGILQSLYREKEEFYSNKLEALLVEHTAPLKHAPTSSVISQTDEQWDRMEHDVAALNNMVAEQDAKINGLVVEKGIVSSQLAEISATKCELKHELNVVREQLADTTAKHCDEVVNLQKRESKAAIRAKHLDRQIAKKNDDLEKLEREFRDRFEVEVGHFKGTIEKLQNENLSLRTALKKA